MVDACVAKPDKAAIEMRDSYPLLTGCFRQHAFAFFCLLVWTAGGELFAADEQQPNIVLILADDVGREALGCYGGPSYGTPTSSTV